MRDAPISVYSSADIIRPFYGIFISVWGVFEAENGPGLPSSLTVWSGTVTYGIYTLPDWPAL